MGKKFYFKNVVWVGLILLVAVCAFMMFRPMEEGIQNEDTDNFTGLMIFTKSSGCDACRSINDVAVKLYEQFPNNIRVIDCVNFAEVSVLLTKLRVDEKDVPVILSFKNGIDTLYTSFTDYNNLEYYVLNLMRTQPPIKSSDRSVSAIKNAEN
jgi:thiol-disulfide isomerase/thioredoxin